MAREHVGRTGWAGQNELVDGGQPSHLRPPCIEKRGHRTMMACC